jgi:HAE1 family hydrophobic/amphiphilic exporter-1
VDLIRWSMNRPVSITVGVLLVVIFGLIGLTRIPIQLTPTVDRAIVSVTTSWPGRSPEEVVDEIAKEQEKRLKNVTNLKHMRSTSGEGVCTINLEFFLGADINRALQEVSDALRQVPDYPDEVDQPVIKASEGGAINAIAWIIIDLDPASADRHPGYDISTLFNPLDREVKPYLERIDGVAEVNIYGGREREVRVLLNPTSLAQRGLSHLDVIAALRAENQNVSAGTISEGKRDYRVRVLGQYTKAQDVLDTIIAYRDSKPVYVRDVGTVEIGHVKTRGFVRSMGEPCLAMSIDRQAGSNVMSIMSEVRDRLEEVRADLLPLLDPAVGKDLRLRLVYDETTYIQSSIDLVRRNLLEGAVLSMIVLLVFLRSLRSTMVVALTIPICIIGTFLVMLAAGRTLNVVSLAGLAFSTGVVVDNAIVVLENIDRRRGLGDPPLVAVYRGAKEVWGAILAGTLCHVAVFIPILTIQEEAGQIFFDLTLALSVSILLSLVAAIMVVPAAQAVLSRIADRGHQGVPSAPKRPGRVASLFGLAPLLAGLAASFSHGIYWLITGWRAWSLRPALIVLMTLSSIFGARWMMPALDYLPAGNQNLVFGLLIIPPGFSIDRQVKYAETIEAKVEPYLRADLDDPASVAALPPIPRFDASGKMFDPMPIENQFIGSFGGNMFVGAISQDPEVVMPVGNLLTMSMSGMPDAMGFAFQWSIFSSGSADSINLEISGPDLVRVRRAAEWAFMQAMQAYGRVQPSPTNFNLSQPEWRLRLSQAGRELGLQTSDLGTAVRGLFDGAYAGDFSLDGRSVDLVVLPTGGRLDYKEQLADIPVATPGGHILPVSSLVEVVPGMAPQEIQRIEELPAITIQITPPPDRPLEEVMEEIRQNIVAVGYAQGLLDNAMRVRLEGSAAKLDEVKTALLGSAAPQGDRAGWQTLLIYASVVVSIAGLGVAAYALLRSTRVRRGDFAYGAVGALLLTIVIGGLLLGIATQPHLVMARFVWTVMIIYLLMSALFESFLYPFIIMFSVPLGITGGFAALALVHWVTITYLPWQNPQQLDVLTMIGFVILIGTVVNNAILLVEQGRNFMGHFKIEGIEQDEPLPPARAIAESVRTRVRPILMTTLTTIMGGLPLVIAPGAGSEMYRGLGAVVLGGLAVSTIFTLVLVPLVFSLVHDMWEGLKAAMSGPRAVGAGAVPGTA